jgi:2-polyprenyl-3-methyl-5-hydroxy-6-metoxy-1,4-benzoquinol methylase
MNTNKEGYFKNRNTLLAMSNDRHAMGEREAQTLIAMLQADGEEDLLAGRSLIDLGCGDQHIRKAFEDRGAFYRGIDIDECNLEIEEFPLETHRYDFAVCLALIEHLVDPGHFLAETKRILKPGGVLWLSTPDIEACGSKFWNDPTHVHPYTRSSMRMLLQMHEFTEVRITPNYRCKSHNWYRDTHFTFFRARHLMPFLGTSRLPLPRFLKGRCSGLFALARNPL